MEALDGSMFEKSEDSSETTGVEELEDNLAVGLTLTATASETVKGTGPGDGGDAGVEGVREDTEGWRKRPMR